MPQAMPLRKQVPDAVLFNSGECIVYTAGKVFFTTKGDNRVWSLTLATGELAVIYDARQAPNPILRGLDNIEVSPSAPEAPQAIRCNTSRSATSRTSVTAKIITRSLGIPKAPTMGSFRTAWRRPSSRRGSPHVQHPDQFAGTCQITQARRPCGG